MINYAMLLWVTVFISWAHSAQILVVTPFPSYSHFTIPFRLAKELANRGHQVTCINPYPQKKPIENLVDIPVVELIPKVEEFKKTLFDLDKTTLLGKLTSMFDLMAMVEENTLGNENVKQLISSGKKFDVIIVEDFFNEVFIGLSHHFKAPVILISATASSARCNYIFANPAPLAYVPNPGGSLTKRMNFWERIENLFTMKMFEALVHFYHLPKQRVIFNKYISNDTDLDTYIYNTSLAFTNSHVSVSDPIPHVPSIKEIGGFHVNPPKKLPKDLQKFLDEATDGAILFSMGSNLRSEDLKPKVRDNILKTFSKIKQKVLWKFGTKLLNAPENVKVMHWLPQQDVLAHPNIKAFISHGGYLSTVEAVYHGVPIIGVPVFGDQKHNIASAVENGYAVKVAVDDLSEETLSWALNEVLTNPKYKNEVKRRSKLMHDQPIKPIDSAIYWVGHVIRHKGAPHLRSGGMDMKWYQRKMIDVFICLFMVSAVIFSVVFVIVRKISNCIFGVKCHKKSVNKKKKNQ